MLVIEKQQAHLFSVVTFLLMFLTIMVIHWAKARDGERRRLEAENNKYVGIIQENKVRIQELENQTIKSTPEHHMLTQHVQPPQPIVYSFPGLSSPPAHIPKNG